MAAEPRTRLNYSLTAHDIATEKLILATHAPDGTYIVAPLLKVIEDIMHKANPGASHQGNHAELDLIAESEIYDDINEILEVMSPIINKVSREISYKCIGGADTHKTTLAIFNLLSNYEWDAKAVITLAAFALNYGEFWLVAQPYPVCRLAKSVANIKQLPDVLEPLFEDVNYLIKVVLDLTRCLIRFLELPKQYINPKTPELQTAAALIPTAVYWIIRSIVECVSMLMSLTGMRHEDVITKTTKAPELSSLGRMIIEFHDQIRQQLYLCYNHINEMEKNVEYAMIVRVMETPHLDNMKPLKHWFKDDQLPLYESSTKKRVSMDVLKKKTVLLLISNVDPPLEYLMILESIHNYTRQYPTRPESQLEVLWIPVVPILGTPWTNEDQRNFEELRNMMPWYSLFHPSLLKPVVIKYIKEVWHFNHKLLLVVMNPKGRIVNTDASHMILIWGIEAFPFTSQREEALRKEETCKMEFLMHLIDEPMFFDWIADGNYICLYGGEDIEWIRKFTYTAKDVAIAAGISLKMLYMGKSNPGEIVQKNIDIIRNENLSYVLDLFRIWFFWVRLQSMWQSKFQDSTSSFDDQNQISKEFSIMLVNGENIESWAVICRGSNDWMRYADADTVLKSLTHYIEWKDDAQEKGFLPALNEYLKANPRPHCTYITLPGTVRSLPDRVPCTECGRSMELWTGFQCGFT